MLVFEWLWVFLFLPLPLLVYWLLPPVKQSTTILWVPFVEEFASNQTTTEAKQTSWWQVGLLSLLWLLLVIATARPQWLGDAIALPVNGRDILLAVDLSYSMKEQDFIINGQTVNRLQAIQKVAGEFIQRREGDRIGLILFGEQAYLQAPLTFDRQTVQTLLDEAIIGLAGKATAIGDAIGLAIKYLNRQSQSNKLLILLTDGANTAGNVKPLQAAALAKEQGLKIYTIGVGADELMVRSLFGMHKINPSEDLDETTLKAIATETNAQYFRARDSQALEKIYQILDQLEPVANEQHYFRPQQSLFYWPLALALLIATYLVLVNQYR